MQVAAPIGIQETLAFIDDQMGSHFLFSMAREIVKRQFHDYLTGSSK